MKKASLHNVGVLPKDADRVNASTIREKVDTTCYLHGDSTTDTANHQTILYRFRTTPSDRSAAIRATTLLNIIGFTFLDDGSALVK